ncbi:MAG: ABC transporter ATP-binding protein [Verrucomicrobiales bacterium]|nr:ABC transporter ATP-binding protein [Verrucomicrobiales bacterium]
MIELRQLEVRAGTFRLRDVDLDVPAGQHAVLLGRTGSGKTTLLEAICGLRPVVAGTVRLNGRDVTRLPPADRGVGLVPQDGALFQHLTVREHLAFALEIRRETREVVAARVEEVADWLGLTPLLDRRPRGLSGGEAQRVAIGRALSFRPGILCLDEPLSALDEETRGEIREVLRGLRAHQPVTILHITHNLGDARQLGDCLFRLRDGVIEPVAKDSLPQSAVAS